MKPTRSQLAILKTMADKAGDQAGEIAYECGEAYLGYRRIARRDVFGLIRLTAVSSVYSDGDLERYRINEIGRQFVAQASAEGNELDVK